MLTKEQFSELRSKGLSVEQIVRFEKGQVPVNTPTPVQEPSKQSFFDAVSSVSPIAPLARLAGGGLGQMFNRQPLQSSEQTSKQYPMAGAIQKTGEEFFTLPASFLNQRFFNAPKVATEKLLNVKYPDSSDNGIANAGATALGLAGLFSSPIGKIVDKAVPGNKIISSIGKGALSGALYTPDNSKSLKDDLMKRAEQSVIGGAIGGAAKGVGKLFFKRQIAKVALDEAGDYIGKAKEQLNFLAKSDPINYSIKTSDIIDDLKNSLDSIKDKTGSAGTALKRWLNILKSQGQSVSADTLIEMENQLGSSVRFSSIKGGSPIRVEPGNQLTERLVKNTRNKVSGIVDSLAKKAGFDKFVDYNKVYSDILSKWSDLDPSKGKMNMFERGFLSGAAGSVAKSAPVAAATYEALKFGTSPEAKNALFKMLNSKGGKALGTGTRNLLTGGTSAILSNVQKS